MESRFTRLRNWYWKNERRVSTMALIGGFVIDIFTLRRVDLLFEDLWIIFLLLLSGVGIITLNYFEKPRSQQKILETTRARIHFWSLILIQFAFGGLLSAFLIFYFRSATLAQSWPFLFILVFAFISNELFRTHYSRLVFQISVFFFSLFSFTIFFLPIIFHRIGPEMFVLSGTVSLLILLGFIFILKYFTFEKFATSKWSLIGSIGGIFILMNILYFVHIIPPIPLLLKDIGIYHGIERSMGGGYEVLAENNFSRFQRFFGLKENIHISSTKQLYAYSAIFSPTKLDTKIIHEWQFHDSTNDEWKTMATINLPIVGGREGGYRTYSLKNNITLGVWRVNVKTERGQIIGRIKFDVELAESNPNLVRQLKI